MIIAPAAPALTPTRIPVTIGRSNARTPEGRQRQTLWRLKESLGYDEQTYRAILRALTSSEYARHLDSTELAYAIRIFYGFLLERKGEVA